MSGIGGPFSEHFLLICYARDKEEFIRINMEFYVSVKPVTQELLPIKNQSSFCQLKDFN